MTTTPSFVIRLPASALSRVRVSSSSDGEFAGVEPDLDGGFDLVDVLAAGTAGALERFFDLTLVDGETIGYTDHWHFGFPCCAPN